MGNRRVHYGWIIAGLSVIVTLGALGFGRFGYTMVLPAMRIGLSLTDSQAGDIAAANMLGYLVLSVVSGYLASRFRPRAVIAGALVLVAASMFATGLARSYPSVVVYRFLAGAGSGGANVPSLGLLAAWFGKSRRGTASGIAVSGSSFGLLITGIVIPAVILRYGDRGWRISWQILAAATVLIALLCAILLRNRPSDKGLEAIGAEDEPKTEDRGVRPKWSLIYRSSAVWWLSAIYVMFGVSYVIYATFFARSLVAEGGFSQKSAGALWSTIGGMSIASGFIWGGVSDKLGRKRTLALVYLLQGLSYAVFGLWRQPAGYYVSAGLFALTAWSIPAVISAAAADSVGSRLAPAALGFMTVFFGIGQTLGPFVAGRIADSTGSFTGAFVFAAGAAFVGSLLSVAGSFRQSTANPPKS